MLANRMRMAGGGSGPDWTLRATDTFTTNSDANFDVLNDMAGQSGDICILCAVVNDTDDNAPSQVTPSGWTIVQAAENNDIGVAAYYRHLDGTETDVAWWSSGGDNFAYAALFLTGPNSFTLNDANDAGTTTINVGGAAAPAIAFMGLGNDDSGGGTFTPSEDAVVSASSGAAAYVKLYYKIYNSSPSDISCAKASGDSEIITGYLLSTG